MLEDRNMARRKGKREERERMNRTRSDRVFSVGNQVLLKTPGRSGAFQCSWEGPYCVKEILSRVNYRVSGPGSGKGRVVHINNIKRGRF